MKWGEWLAFLDDIFAAMGEFCELLLMTSVFWIPLVAIYVSR